MTFTPIDRGTEDWDVPLNAALTDQDARITALAAQAANATTESAQARGFINWNYRPEMVQAGTAPGSGFILMQRVYVPAAATVHNVHFAIATAGATLTAGQNFVGLYNASGTRLGVSADLSTRWASDLDVQSYALTAAVSVTAGYYYTALVSNGTTRPSFWRAVSSSNAANLINTGLTATTQAYGYYPTANTSLPASLTYSTRTPLTAALWTAVS
jgi:hypothetical protein